MSESLIDGVPAGLVAEIAGRLGPRFAWALTTEPVRVVALMLEEERAEHRVTRAALQTVQQVRYPTPADEPN